jgi:hypothetical protein
MRGSILALLESSEVARTTNVWRIFMNGEGLKPYSSSGLARQEKCFSGTVLLHTP